MTCGTNVHLTQFMRAVEGLSVRPDRVLVDGNRCPILPMPSEPVIKGDSRVPAIAAASILAKVARDRELVEMDLLYPGYGLAQNKGYPTVQHLAALKELGATVIHRRSFAPVREALGLVDTSVMTGEQLLPEDRPVELC